MIKVTGPEGLNGLRCGLSFYQGEAYSKVPLTDQQAFNFERWGYTIEGSIDGVVVIPSADPENPEGGTTPPEGGTIVTDDGTTPPEGGKKGAGKKVG